MGVKPFRTINSKDKDLMSLQDSVKDTLASIIRSPLLSENIVTVDLVTAPKDISHGLNRNIQGWFIIRQNAQAAVWEPSVSTTPSKTVVLEASAAVTVTIYFF